MVVGSYIINSNDYKKTIKRTKKVIACFSYTCYKLVRFK